MRRIRLVGCASALAAAGPLLLACATARADVPASAAPPPGPPATTATAPATPAPATPATPAPATPTPATPTTVSIPALFSPAWFGGVTYAAQAEGGVSFNPQRPADGLNTGQLTTDHANQAQLNQLLLTVSRATDPKATGYDVGFAFQAMYGSDVRFYHFVDELDRTITSRYQLGIIQANVAAHLPWLTPGGIDVKAGEFPTPLGYETIDPSSTPFYSHSYIFDYGLPFLNTGLLGTAHANGTVDLWGGVVSGNQTTLGANTGDDNGAPAGVFGIGLNNLLGGKLTVLALSQVGAENPSRLDPGANGALRYYNDLVITYKPTDKLTFTTEANYVRDDDARAEGYGAAQYVSYALSGQVTLNARAEVWRDNSGFYVARYPGNLDAIDALEGRPSTTAALPPTTYGEVTLGLTYKPALPTPLALQIRPELRYDQSLAASHPFDGLRDRGYFTASVDAVLGF